MFDLNPLEIAVISVVVIVIAFYFLSVPNIGFAEGLSSSFMKMWVGQQPEARHFNMDVYVGRPQYGPTPRGLYSSDNVVVETLQYPRSGQPFQYTQDTIQDARFPTDEQFNKTMTLFDLSGNPMMPTPPADVDWSSYASSGKVPAWQTASSSASQRPRDLMIDATGAAAAQTVRPASVTSPAAQAAEPTRSAGYREMSGGRGSEPKSPEIRKMAELDFGQGNPLIDPRLAAANINPSLYGAQFTRDPRNGDIVWTQSSGLDAASTAAKWQANPAGSWPLPMDVRVAGAPAGTLRTSPPQMPTGGIIEGYSDTNYYSRPGEAPLMADGLPFDANRQQIGPDGKLYTGVAYRPPELNAHLDFLPTNHPARLQNRHWQAAAIQNKLPPTEARKFMQRVAEDVKRFRQVPWSFGGA